MCPTRSSCDDRPPDRVVDDAAGIGRIEEEAERTAGGEVMRYVKFLIERKLTDGPDIQIQTIIALGGMHYTKEKGLSVLTIWEPGGAVDNQCYTLRGYEANRVWRKERDFVEGQR